MFKLHTAVGARNSRALALPRLGEDTVRGADHPTKTAKERIIKGNCTPRILSPLTHKATEPYLTICHWLIATLRYLDVS
jgi:hypothetical protein